MSEIIVVNYKDITAENNPTLCMSPHRFLKQCNRCRIFHQRLMYYRNKEKMSAEQAIQATINNLKCQPQLSDEIKIKMVRKYKLLDMIKNISAEVELLNEELGEKWMY